MFSSASSLSAEDRVWMDRAFVLAEQALQADEVPVGCVFVYEGMEIGSGRNRVNQTHDPTRHAEMVALEFMESSRNDIAEILPSTSLYVTLEPCIMCAAALYNIGVGRIVYGADNERFGGMRSVGNAQRYRAKPETVEVVAGVDCDRSIRLLKAFYDKQNPFAPDDKRKVKKAKIEEKAEEKVKEEK